MNVCAFVKYDLYPYYIVCKGELQEDFSLHLPDRDGFYRPSSILKIQPVADYEDHKNTHDKIVNTYRGEVKELEKEILSRFGVKL